MTNFYLTGSSVVFKTINLWCFISIHNKNIVYKRNGTLAITTVALRSGEHMSRPNQTICDAT